MVLILMVVLLQAAGAQPINRKISGTMPPHGDVWNFAISPNGAYVVYTADQQTDRALELFSVPIDGSKPPVRLSALLPSGVEINAYAIAPDSSRVVYVVQQDTLGVHELYSVPLSGGGSSQAERTARQRW